MIGAGTDYALLLVARYREELRRHEDRHEAMAFALHRAAPAIFASAATVALGMLCLSFAEINSTAGLGPVAAIGVAVTFAGDGHAAARAAGDLRAVGLLAQAPGLPAAPSPPPTASGPASVARSATARAGSGSSRPVLLLLACLGLFRLDASGLSTEDTYTKEFDSIKGQKLLDDARPGRQLQHDPGGHQRRPGGRRRRVAERRRRARRTQAPQPIVRRPGRTSRPPSTPTSPPPRPPTRSRRPATPSTASTGPTRWSVAAPRSTSTPRSPPSATAG